MSRNLKKKLHFTLLRTGMTREVITAIFDNWHNREYCMRQFLLDTILLIPCTMPY